MDYKVKELFCSQQREVKKRGLLIHSSHISGLQLFVRELLRADPANGRPVMFVHGATLASYLWDVNEEGFSWMQYMAQAGLPSYALDIRGYGASSKPRAMEEDPLHNPPQARAKQAIEDLDDAVEYIRKSTGSSRIHLIGGSWGSIICGLYASTVGRPKIHRLVLVSPIFCTPNREWIDMIADPNDQSKINPKLGAYRWVSEDDIRARWDRQIPIAAKEDWRPEQGFRALLDEAFRWDQEGAQREPREFRAPNGTLVDLFEAFNNKPLFDPRAIQAPTMLIRGENDPTSTDEDARALFEKLGSREKRYVVIGDGSHFLSGEKNRWQLFSEVRGFLE